MWQGRTDGGSLAAVKVLHAPADRRGRRRLVAQARRARAAGHPRVLAPLTIITSRSGPATVWPWAPGRDLAGRLRRHGPPEVGWARALVDELDAAVAALHDRGLVHGALTADHVLLDADGHPLLIGLDPSTRAGAEARAADLWAMAQIRSLLLADGTDPGPGPATVSGRRRLPAVAIGLTLVATGAIGALVAADAGPTCPAHDGAEDLRADVNGDGCEDRLEWSPETGRLSAETASGPRAWHLGQPGDRFLLGDWDCDGTLTPGLHRPSTGRTYGFGSWPDRRPDAADLVDDAPRCPTEP